MLSTALSALLNGFRTIVLEEAVAPSRPELLQPALENLEVAKAQRLSSKEFRAQRSLPEDVDKTGHARVDG